MVIVINPDNKDSYWGLLDQSFVARNKVFNDRLGWGLSTIFGREIDEYDKDSSFYLICYDKDHGVYGGCRLLPTTSKYMLEETFAYVKCGDLPKRKDIWESSRFFIDTATLKKNTPHLAKIAIYELIVGLLDFGLSRSLTSIITLTDVRIERIFSMLGCPLKRLSTPVQIGNTLTIGAQLEITEQSLLNLLNKSKYEAFSLIEL